MNKLVRFALSYILIFVICVQSFAPYILIHPVNAVAAEYTATIRNDATTHSLIIEANTNKPLSYLVAYRTTDGNIAGSQSTITEKQEKNFYKEIYLGTKSGTDTKQDSVVRGIYKIEVPEDQWIHATRFIFENNNLTILSEGISLDLQLTDEEKVWLTTGSSSQPTVTPTPTEIPQVITPTITATPTPTIIEQPTEGTISVTVTKDKTVDQLSSLLSEIMPFVFTDKSDYAPTEKATISGKDFLPNTVYSITVFSYDSPATSATESITTTSEGTFVYEYQLDGNYRPNYAVEIKDTNGTIIAKTTFTDSLSALYVVSGSQTPNPVIKGNAATYTANVTNSNGSTARLVSITSISNLPSGASLGSTQCIAIPGDGNPHPITFTINTTGSTPVGTTNNLSVTATRWQQTSGPCGITVNGTMSTSGGGNTSLVVAAAKVNTTTTITSDSPDPSNLGASYTVNVSVARSGSSGQPTGTVTVSDGTNSCQDTTASGSGGTSTYSCLLTSTTAGSKTLTATYAGDSNFNGSSGTRSHTVSKATPTITFGAAPTPSYLGGNFVVSATTTNTDSSTLTYSRVSGPCAFVSGATFSSSGVGTCVVQASGAATANFNATSNTQNIAISKANQTITVVTHAPPNATNNSTFTVAATGGGSGNTIVYSSGDTGICTNSGATFTMHSSTGTCPVRYDQAGNANFNAASQVIESTAAIKTNQTINFAPLSNKEYGSTPFTVSATASSGLGVTFSIASGPATIVGNTVTITGIGTVTVRASQPGNATFNAAVPVDQTFIVQDTLAPTVPTNGAPNNTAIATNNFDFTWDNSTDASSITYEFQSSLNAASSGGVLTTGLWHSGVLPSAMIHSSGAPDGTWYWQVRAIDAIGNTSAWSSIWNVTIDTVQPTVHFVFPTPGPSATSFQAVFSENVVKSEAENPANYYLHNWPGAGGSGDLVGDATITYDASNKTATITFTHPDWYISPEQQWGVQNIHDSAGNIQQVNPYESYSTQLINPVTTDSGTDANWHTSAVTVNFSCTDIYGSGCKQTYYTTDGTTPSTSSPSGSSVTLNSDGVYTIQYFSVDNAGNSEDVKTAAHTVKIDTTAPTDPGTPVPTIAGPTNQTTNTWHWTAAFDALSGIQEYVWNLWQGVTSIGSGTVDAMTTEKTIDLSSFGDGLFSFDLKARDYAGNESSVVTSMSTLIDTVAPESSISSPLNPGSGSTVYTNNWNGIIKGTAIDNASGVSGVKISIQNAAGNYFNGTSFVGDTEILLDTSYSTGTWEYTGLVAPIEDSYIIRSHAIDNAGTMESTYTVTVVLDKTIPEVSIALNPVVGDAQNGWYATQPEITLSATDSNIDVIEYQWDSQVGSWTTYTAPFKPASEGSHMLYYRSRDKADNLSEVGIKNIKWNKTSLNQGPQNVSVSPNPTNASTAKVTWNAATSNTIGIDRYEVKWTLKNGDKSYTVSVGNDIREYVINNLIEGVWTVQVTAFDASGNSLNSSVDVTVDRTSPATPTLSVLGTATGTVTLGWSKIDDATDYIIWYGITPGTYVYGAKVGNIQNFTVQGLGSGTYYFIVRAIDAAGNQSSNSNEVSSGAIVGAPGVSQNTPAQGFTEKVLGTNSLTPTPHITGSVLGSTTNKDIKTNWWPWILFILAPWIVIWT